MPVTIAEKPYESRDVPGVSKITIKHPDGYNEEFLLTHVEYDGYGVVRTYEDQREIADRRRGYTYSYGRNPDLDRPFNRDRGLFAQYREPPLPRLAQPFQAAQADLARLVASSRLQALDTTVSSVISV